MIPRAVTLVPERRVPLTRHVYLGESNDLRCGRQARVRRLAISEDVYPTPLTEEEYRSMGHMFTGSPFCKSCVKGLVPDAR